MPLHMHEALGKCHWHNNNAIHMKVRTCIHILHTHVGTSIGGFGGQCRTHRYIDRYIQLEVSRIASMRLAPISLVLTLTRFALVRMYTQRMYIHV